MVALVVLVAGILMVLFVLNVLIWFRERLVPGAPEEVPDVFSRTSRSFAGADFIAAAVALLIGFIGPRLLVLFMGPVQRIEGGFEITEFLVDWRFAGPYLAVLFLVAWATIHRRHTGLLDWKWSASATIVISAGFGALWYIVGIPELQFPQ